MKVYNSETFQKSTEVCRISLKEPRYIKPHKGKQTYKLSSSELKKFNKILDKKPNGGNKVNNLDTVWDAILKIANDKSNGKNIGEIERPNYKELN